MRTTRTTRDGREPTPIVPLEAGAGPDNPPCPACGEPLFGWLDARPGLHGPVRRCESCGLGVVGDADGSADALAALDRLEHDDAIRIVSRGSFAAWIGSAGWAGLEPASHYLFTPEAVRRLVASRDQVVVRTGWMPGAGIASMWQTLLNGLTFGRNVALGAFGRGTAVPARQPWQRRIDALISILAAIPALLVAVPLELLAAIFRRGAVIKLQYELL